MYGNGVGIGTVAMLQGRPTLRVLRLALAASLVAAAGSTTPLTVVRLAATPTRRTTATSTWDFASHALVLKKGYTLRRTANLFQE